MARPDPEALTPEHDLSEFTLRCRHATRWYREEAHTSQRCGPRATFVLCGRDRRRVAAAYSLAFGAVTCGQMGRFEPVLILWPFGVEASLSPYALGKRLAVDALRRAERVAQVPARAYAPRRQLPLRALLAPIIREETASALRDVEFVDLQGYVGVLPHFQCGQLPRWMFRRLGPAAPEDVEFPWLAKR